MRVAARNGRAVRHTYNLVDLPIVIAGKSGTAEFGVRDSKGRLPFHSWFVGFVAEGPAKTGVDPNGSRPSRLGRLSLGLRLRLADTVGNAATEIVKYFLQLHFDIKNDYRIAVPARARQLLWQLRLGSSELP